MVPRNARASPSGEHSTSTTEAADEEVWRRTRTTTTRASSAGRYRLLCSAYTPFRWQTTWFGPAASLTRLTLAVITQSPGADRSGLGARGAGDTQGNEQGSEA